MRNPEETCASLRAQIEATEAQLATLKRDLVNAEKAAAAKSETASSAGNHVESLDGTRRRWPLLQEEYRRYGRQMIVPQVGGLHGQNADALLARDCG